jgi:hypothetical protein
MAKPPRLPVPGLVVAYASLVVNYQFPRDEFDNYDARPTPVGVHRAPRSRWSRLWPFLLVAALFASVAVLGIWSLTREQTIEADPGPVATAEPGENRENGTAEPTEPAEPGENGDGDGETPGDVNQAASIRVLNDTGPSGEAGRGRDRLTAAGFTNVVADNFPGDSGLTSSAVWFTGDNAQTAAAVAEALGIPGDRVIEHAVAQGEINVIVRGALPAGS